MNFGEVYDFASQVADQMIAEKQEVFKLSCSEPQVFISFYVSWNNVGKQ